jgi:sugar-specific transcriptional regulator TrmB
MVVLLQKMKSFDLDKRESEIYLSLLESGEMSVLEISKRTEIPRSTVYRLVSSLIKKGFLNEEVRENGIYISPKDPSELDYLMKAQKEKVDDMVSAIGSLSDLTKNFDTGNPKTKVRYYTGQKGLRQMLWNSLKARDGIVGYSEFGRLNIVGEKFYSKYVEEFRIRNLEDRVISNEDCLDYYVKYVLGEDKKHQIDDYGIRIIEKDKFYVSGDTSIYNDIYAVSYWSGGEVVGVEIENRELVKLHRSIFEILWEISEDITVYNG